MCVRHEPGVCHVGVLNAVKRAVSTLDNRYARLSPESPGLHRSGLFFLGGSLVGRPASVDTFWLGRYNSASLLGR
ncbi:hypothetical protein BCAR13_1640034 [Paraburkholderia caribensis]|nr:hypothetical protein BCAR13_1640034 [Paraburkholderia caribensis]